MFIWSRWAFWIFLAIKLHALSKDFQETWHEFDQNTSTFMNKLRTSRVVAKSDFIKGKVHSVLKFGLVRMAGHIPGIYNFLAWGDRDLPLGAKFCKFAAWKVIQPPTFAKPKVVLIFFGGYLCFVRTRPEPLSSVPPDPLRPPPGPPIPDTSDWCFHVSYNFMAVFMEVKGVFPWES